MRARIFVRLLILWMAVLTLAYTAEVTPATSPLNLLPWPKSVDVAKGAVAIGEQSRIVAPNAELKPLANILHDELRLAAGLNLAVGEAPARSGDIVIGMNKQLRSGENILSVRNGEFIRTRAKLGSGES